MPTARRSFRNWLLLVGLAGLVVVAAIVVALAGTGGRGPVSMALHAGVGTSPPSGVSCPADRGSDGSDFGSYFAGLPGMRVVVRNESGTTLGVGDVPASGIVQDRATPGGPLGIMTQDCVFSFQIPLTGDAKFYEFDLGIYGTQSISKGDLQSAKFMVTLDLTPD